MNATHTPDSDAIQTVQELIAYTCAMELEAADHYEELADQMEVHNNLEVAELFRKLSGLSNQLKEHYLSSSKGAELPHVVPWDYRFECIELLRSDHTKDVHYMMTPYHAVELALRCKKRLVEFFSHLSETHSDEDTRQMAKDFKEEQAKHISILKQWLTEYPEPDEDWNKDDDPPMLQE